MNIDARIIIGIIVALGCGLLVGTERERRKATGPRRAPAGVRTFTLTAVAGALGQALQQPWLILVGALMILALATIAYWRERSDDPGITTEVALYITYLLGVGAIDYPLLSAGVAVVVAGLLAARNSLHNFSSRILSESELRDGLYLAAAALVVLPLLPDQTTPWLAGANPRRLWGLVVVLMAVQAGGYVALRFAGAGLGLALSGLASGFVSSTATIIAMGTRSRNEPDLLGPCVSGALFSSVATFVQLFVVTTAIYPSALRLLAPCLVAGLVVAAIVAGLSYRRNGATNDAGKPQGRAFSLLQTLGFAALLSGFTTVIALVNTYFGHAAVAIGAAIAGFADVHSAAASTLSLGASGAISEVEIVLPILFALTTNTGSKLIGAFAAGSMGYGSRVAVGLLATLAAVWASYFVL
jgi:uncharacterized membrane protein (DUF4010 family)